EVRVAPVLDDDVDVAGLEALPGELLLDLRHLDGVAELVLQQVGHHVGARLVPDPRVDRDLHRAGRGGGVGGALGGGGGRRAVAVDGGSAAAGGERERQEACEQANLHVKFLFRGRERLSAPCVMRSSMTPSRTVATPATKPMPKSGRWENPSTTSSPSAPAPTSPPTTTMARVSTIPWLAASRMARRASGSCTFRRICPGVEPVEVAASITEAGTFLMPSSTSRTTGGTA